MIPEQEIKDWWERKLANYLQNYARRNRLTVAEAKAGFFTETHEKFVESVPHLLKQPFPPLSGLGDSSSGWRCRT